MLMNVMCSMGAVTKPASTSPAATVVHATMAMVFLKMVKHAKVREIRQLISNI